MVVKILSDGWYFTQTDKPDNWHPVSKFPTTVHVELFNAKRIPDPFIGLNEWEVQWIGESNWAFSNQFLVTETDLTASNVDLVFEGIDTFARIHLNGHYILQTSNQFVCYRASVKHNVKLGLNTLVIEFESAFRKGRELEKQHGKLNLWNGDSSRLHVRKAQYNYGWDWGPVFMTVGPWKPISLHSYDVRITDLDIRTQVTKDLNVQLSFALRLSVESAAIIAFALRHPNNTTSHIVEGRLTTDSGLVKEELSFETGQVNLWYPVGYGQQPLYHFEVQVTDQTGRVLDSKTEAIAFRRARVIQDTLVDQEGLSFLFEINNIRVFCGGSNWIPADSFLTTVTPERYKAWLQLLVKGNQNMIRVWGGGIYEAEEFYRTCDELGILVWQDFMFGCGQYPAYDSFIDTVREEAEQAVKRLRHHPSVVIFAGNNEDYQIAESLKLELDYSDETSDFRKTNFPARHIYERVLPDIVNSLCDVYYHRGSPYSGQGHPATEPTLGDIHQWNVWHGSQESWHNWDKLAGRFVSEFGMQAYPNLRTVDYWLGGNKLERYPQSRTNCNHNKADGFERRLELYLMENFRHSFDMESYIYYTQVMQAETLSAAYRLWRRNWQGRGREYTAGALVWQMNDCWPVTSWAIVDYFLRPKPAYFAIARELRPYTVGSARKEKITFPDDTSVATFTIDTTIEIWGTNSTTADKQANLEVTYFDLHSDWQKKWSKTVVLAPNSSTELHQGLLEGQPARTKLGDIPRVIIVAARLLDSSGFVLSRHSNWPEPFKYITFPSLQEVGFKVVHSSDGESVILSADKPVKGIVLDVDDDGDVQWSDQAIDLMPGDPQIVEAAGLRGRTVKVRFLGDESVL